MTYWRVLRGVVVVGAVTGCAPSDESATAQGYRAQRDSISAAHFTRFGRPSGSRGMPDSVLVGPLAVRMAAYEALLPGGPYLGAVDPPPGHVPADHRPWLQAEFLSHEGEYARFLPMDEPLLQGLLATERFRGACGRPQLPVCPDTGTTIYLFSALYRVGPGVLRVFLAQRGDQFAEENMFRLEHRGDRWMIAESALIMIT